VTLQISQSQNGQAISIKEGDTVELCLPENPSTGYRWTVDALDEAHVTVDETGFRSRGAAGSGGDACWRLRATGPGDTTVALKRWRPFEGNRSIVERFAITLHITSSW
jgi:inhibitor of cysteine peptidase